MKTPSTVTSASCGTASSTPRLGLALSCGGARGLAHIGVIQVLEENGIVIDAVAGASMGAYIGALWAAGYDGHDLELLAAEIKTPRDLWRRMDFIFPPVGGLVRGERIKERLAASLGGRTFDELDRDLYVVAANLDTYERRVFSSGDVASAVHASLAIPGFCVPVAIEGQRYGDGGIVDPLPVHVLLDEGCDNVIAVNVVPSFDEVERGLAAEPVVKKSPTPLRTCLRRLNSALNVFAPGNVIDTLRRSVFSAQIRMAHSAAHRAAIVLHPVMRGAHWHDYHRFDHYIELGRRAAEAQLPAILALGHVQSSIDLADEHTLPQHLFSTS